MIGLLAKNVLGYQLHEKMDDEEWNTLSEQQFVHHESAYRNQAVKFRRATEYDRIVLGEVLQELFKEDGIDETSVLSMALAYRYGHGESPKEQQVWDNQFAIWNFDLFSCILKNRDTDEHYDDGEFHETTLIVNTTRRTIILTLTALLAGMDSVKYMRVTVMSPDNSDSDDSLTMKSKNLPQLFSFILSYSETEDDPAFERFDEIENSLLYKRNNKIPRTDTETECASGGLEFDIDHQEQGEWLFKQNMYYDAFTMLEREYNYLKDQLHEDHNEDIMQRYDHVCNMIGICLSKINRDDESAFFYEQSGIKLSLPQLFSLAAIDDLAPYHDRITIGYVLKNLWGLDVQNLFPCMFIYDMASGEFKNRIEDTDSIFDYPLYPKKSADKVFVLSCTHACYYTDDEEDKSVLCHNAPIVIATHTINRDSQSPRIRIDMFRQNFATNDNNRFLTSRNIPLNVSFTTCNPEDFKCEVNLDSLIAGIERADELRNARRFMECLKLSKWIFKILSIQFRDMDEEELTTQYSGLLHMYYDTCYNVGYCLMELDNKTTAEYYLEISARSLNSEHVIEYINCLANTKDPRALDVVEDTIARAPMPESEELMESWNFLMAFLKRRKAYILIDMKRYNEARKMLRKMLNDPRCRDFAIGELDYLKDIEKE